MNCGFTAEHYPIVSVRMPSIAPSFDAEPKATTKHTLCGYAWPDVTNALIRAIGQADMARSLRWSAELICSDLGLGRLEATLLHAWSLHVGGAYPGWPRIWAYTIKQLRSYWQKSGGDIKSVRNTPVVRQLVGEAVAALVLSAKKPLSILPTAADCYKEAESMRQRLRAGGGVGEQLACRRIWASGVDGLDLKTIGNEFEAALRSNQVGRLLFWVIWIITLDGQTDAPQAKERGPAFLPVKQRKSIIWFLVALIHELANESAFLPVDDRDAMFEALELTWPKLGTKGRRDTIASLALSVQEHNQRRTSLTLSGPAAPPPMTAIRNAIQKLDEIYSGIANEARKFMLERPVMAGLTAEAAAAARAPVKMNDMDKMALAFSLAFK